MSGNGSVGAVPTGQTRKFKVPSPVVVTPVLEVEYKVVILDRDLARHQDPAEKKITTDPTYVLLSLEQDKPKPAFTQGAHLKVEGVGAVEAYEDAAFTNRIDLSKPIPNAKLAAKDPYKVYLKGTQKGAFDLKLEVEAPVDRLFRAGAVALEKMAVAELTLKIHAYDVNDLDALQVDPEEPISAYHDALKALRLPDQKELTDQDKVQKGRILHIQRKNEDKKVACSGRAKMIVPKSAVDNWPAGTDAYEIVVEQSGSALELFDAEWDGTALKMPHRIKASDLRNGDRTLWVQGKTASSKVRDVILDLALDRPDGGPSKKRKHNADWARVTVVEIDEVKLVYENAKDEHPAWDKKKKRFYININEKGDPDGRKITVGVRLSKKIEGVPIRFMLAPDKDNTKKANWNIDFPADAKSSGNPVKWKDVPAALKHSDRRNRRDFLHLAKATDADGLAELELVLSRFGGDKFRIGAYIEQDAHLAKYVHGHSDLGKREPVFAKHQPIQIWRKVWYQVSRPKKTAMPAPKGFVNSQRKVFLEPIMVKEKKVGTRDFTVDPYRPDWQFNPGGTTNKKLCVGTHNDGDVKNLFAPSTKATSPKFHVFLCDEQYDARGVVTDEQRIVWSSGTGPKDVAMASTNVSDRNLTIIDPPLQGGSLIISATWKAKENVAGTWTEQHSGTLPASAVTLRKDRDSKRKVRVAPPGRCAGGAGGCPCGGAPCDLVVDGTHQISARLILQAADGGYNGWAVDDNRTSVIKGGRADYAIHNTMGHEMGHLFGKVRVSSTPGLPDHPKYYERRGGSGPHCANNATFDPDPTAPALDPTVAGERDAQGMGAGSWEHSTTSPMCIIFGYTVDNKREWCPHCALDFILWDLSAFG